jgi:hypothetical protein
MRNTMAFYNHCLEGETMTAIVAFPYTPDMIRDMNEVQIYALGKMLGFSYSEEYGVSVADTFRQKLFETWYFVEDSSRMHAIAPCQSRTKLCNNLASSLSGNIMCKMCQLDLPNREPSIVHDSHDQFFRHKIKVMYNFEEAQDFDRKRTIKLTMRRMVKKYDLEKMFKDFAVDLGKVEIFYNPYTHRMQCLYLVCKTAEEAKRVLQNKHLILGKLGREGVKIEALSNNIGKSCSMFSEPENVCALITPPSNLEVVEELPKGEDLLTQIYNLVQVVTQLEIVQFSLETDSNPITGERDYRHIFVTLPGRQYVDRIYEAQPFFGCLVVHKLTHSSITPFTKYSNEVCLTCPNDRHPKNIRDMCLDCAAMQIILPYPMCH